MKHWFSQGTSELQTENDADFASRQQSASSAGSVVNRTIGVGRQLSLSEAHPKHRHKAASFDVMSLCASVILGVATGIIIVGASLSGAGASASSTLEQVAAGDLEMAGRSLIPAAAPTLVEEAKACRAPLAMLVLKATGPSGGFVRVRSGPYLSPKVRIGPSAQRIALPFPAPYATGHGQIAIENASDGVDLFLLPGVRIAAGTPATIANVNWNPTAHCGGGAP